MLAGAQRLVAHRRLEFGPKDADWCTEEELQNSMLEWMTEERYKTIFRELVAVDVLKLGEGEFWVSVDMDLKL